MKSPIFAAIKNKIMKHILIAIVMLSIYTSSFAQSYGEIPEKLNCIKINPTSLLGRTINLQYERVVHRHMSVALQVRYTIPKTYNSNFFTPNDVSYTNLKFGALTITPEYRYYVKEAMRGFYVAPYLRYRQMNLDFNFPIPYNGAIQTGQFDGRFSAYGGGVMLGVHQNLGNNFSIDYFIIGLQYMHNTIKMNGNHNLNLNSIDQQQLLADINQTIDGASRFIKNLSASVNANSAMINGSYNGIGFRGLGINLGYRF